MPRGQEQDGIDDQVGEQPSPGPDRPPRRRWRPSASIPVLTAPTAKSSRTVSICWRHERGLQSDHATHLGRVLCGHRGDGAGAVHTERGEGLEVGLCAGTPARVGSGDGQRRRGVSGPAPSHHRRAAGVSSSRDPQRRRSRRRLSHPRTASCIAGDVPWPRACILGTGGMTSLDVLSASSTRASGTAMATVAVRRVEGAGRGSLPLTPGGSGRPCAAQHGGVFDCLSRLCSRPSWPARPSVPTGSSWR